MKKLIIILTLLVASTAWGFEIEKRSATSGPASSLDYQDACFDGTTGKALKNCGTYVDVRSYGAVCDGSTNDSTAINAAISAVSAGGTIYIPESALGCKITSAIVVNKSITLTGNGKSTIKSIGSIIGISVTGTNVTIKDLIITGDLSNTSYGIYGTNAATNIKIYDNTISEVMWGIVTEASNATITHNTVTLSTLTASQPIGIFIYDGPGHVTTNDCLIESNTVTMPIYTSGAVYALGINIANLSASILNHKIINNIVYNGYDGIQLRGQFLIVTGNYIENSYEAGILLGAGETLCVTHSIIQGNIIKDCGKWGIYSGEYDRNNIIDGNTLSNCATLSNTHGAITVNANLLNWDMRTVISNNTIECGTGSYGSGIYLTSNSGVNAKGVTVIGNNINGCPEYGICVSRMKEVLIRDNRVTNCANKGIALLSDQSTDISVYGNFLSDNLTNFYVHPSGITNLTVNENPGYAATIGALIAATGTVAAPSIIADDADSGFYFGSKGFNWGVDEVKVFGVDSSGASNTTGYITTNSGFIGSVITAFTNNATLNINNRTYTLSNTPAIKLAWGTFSGAGATQEAVVIAPIYNQSTTSSATDLLINRTQTAVGSGAQLLFDAQANNTSQTRISNAGFIKTVGGLTVGDILGTELAATTAAEYTYTPASPGWSATDAPLVFTRTASASNLTIVQTTQTISAGTWYKVVYTVGGSVAGSVIASVGGTSAPSRTMAAGTYTEYLYAVATTRLTFTVVATTAGTISGISCKAVTQAPAAGDILMAGVLSNSNSAVTCAATVCTDVATSYAIYLTTTGTDTMTLADGILAGQEKYISHKVDGGQVTITPTNFSGGTSVTLTNPGHNAKFHWNGTKWDLVVTNGGSII